MGEAGYDEPVHVLEDARERLRPLGGRGRQRRADIARSRAGEDGIAFRLRQVAGNPVEEAAALLAEDLQIDVAQGYSTSVTMNISTWLPIRNSI